MFKRNASLILFSAVLFFSLTAVQALALLSSAGLPKDFRGEEDNDHGWEFVSPMPTARIGPAVVAGGDDGLIYVMGGSTENTVATVTGANEAYSTEDDTWMSLASMPTPRRFAMAAVDLNGRIYVIGGGSPKFTPPFTNVVERYLPDKDMWEELPPMPTKRVNAAITTGLDGLIYVMGGFNGNQTKAVEVFDPNSNTWSERAPLLVASGGGLGGATGPDGTIYAIGGITGGLVNTTELDLVQAYDPGSNSWSMRSSMPTARHGLASTTGQNDLIYVIGGTTGEGGGIPAADGVLNAVESYNAIADLWATAPSLLIGIAGHGAATGEDGTICTFGGIDNSNNILNSVECFRPRNHDQRRNHGGHHGDDIPR